jgi:hypothetical protein
VTRHAPARLTTVWLALTVATCATWWLGTGHLGERGASWEVLSLIAVACVKIHLVGYEFMELRSAPLALRTLFSTWTIALGVTTAVFAVT